MLTHHVGDLTMPDCADDNPFAAPEKEGLQEDSHDLLRVRSLLRSGQGLSVAGAAMMALAVLPVPFWQLPALCGMAIFFVGPSRLCAVCGYWPLLRAAGLLPQLMVALAILVALVATMLVLLS